MLIPLIDKKKTKVAVEEKLKLYNYYTLSVLDDNQLILDNKTFDITLNINEIELLEKEKEKLLYIKLIIKRYNRLCLIHKKIIYFTYLVKEKTNDAVIANNLGFDFNYYYRIKKEAIICMAYALNAEEYEETGNEINK